MIRYSLSIAGNWQNTFRKWASELRAKTPLESSDFSLANNSFDTSVTSSMTVTETSRRFNYDVKGMVCYCSLDAAFTLSGAASTKIYITLPFPGKKGWNQGFGLHIGGVALAGWGYIASESTTIEIGRYDNGNFGLSSTRIAANFFYEIN